MATAKSRYSYYVEPGALEMTERPRRFLEAFAAVLEHGSYGLALDTYARLRGHCARCTAACQLFESTREPRDVPCRRTELLLRVYRRYFTAGGAWRARLLGGWELTDEYLDTMAEEYYRCTACRRCKASCPLAIDHGLITHLARWLLAEINVVPKALVVAVREQLEGKGNTSAITVPGLKDTCEFLEEELHDTVGIDAKFPFDVADSEYIFFPAVSDYLLEADTLMGNAAVMHVTGGSWTIGTHDFDGINYGLFYSDRMLERIIAGVLAEAKRLNARKILVGECGHATRAAWYLATYGGAAAPEVVHCMQYAHRMLAAGKLKLKPEKIPERVTYHDPCNIARVGRITEEPREILKAICADYVEMTPNRTRNYCCGGGSGMVSLDEIRAFRTGPMGRRKAAQIRDTGAQLVISPCANCKKQLREVCEDNELPGVQVLGLHDLLLRMIDFDAAVPAGPVGDAATERSRPEAASPDLGAPAPAAGVEAAVAAGVTAANGE